MAISGWGGPGARHSVGFRVAGIAGHRELFGEGPSRVVLSVPPPSLDRVRAAASEAGVAVTELGRGGGDRLIIDGLLDVAVADAVGAARRVLPASLGSG
jgi:phosphoribosylformylglycinamidine synthase